ncbi:sporulation protein YjcZ [Alteribacter lacisalsi]|uniref:Sporulation protein YjcZ n=1 Tax=Alteribacter lacisalsi TaxID=2045244 RepID=A0A2W0H6R0_9BACI|nr:YjcZ family sporulation protein [Alteribacter lacisalsi]PYZ96807.1 sporulation protein YjcZ [Alteribacter lacisalsi]
MSWGNFGGSFVLVIFILLVIIGCACYNGGQVGGAGYGCGCGW